MSEKIIIVMPAYNEEKMVAKTIRSVKKKGFNNIIVVDDGSSDKTTKVAQKEGVNVLTHPINRGLGAALGTGIEAAIEENASIIVTFDSDGQHHPDDIKKVIKPIIDKKADAVIGTRLKNPKGMPVIRRLGNWGFNIITFILFGVWTTDSQSGFRAFSREAAKKIEIKANRMEVSSEIIKEIGTNNLKLEEVPIKAIYTDYSMAHGQSSLNAFKILGKLILKRFMR
ncbi:MAG: glycosyltransferase family 2 protein [Candidatus Nanoarchaeia archaeon]